MDSLDRARQAMKAAEEDYLDALDPIPGAGRASDEEIDDLEEEMEDAREAYRRARDSWEPADLLRRDRRGRARLLRRRPGTLTGSAGRAPRGRARAVPRLKPTTTRRTPPMTTTSSNRAEVVAKMTARAQQQPTLTLCQALTMLDRGGLDEAERLTRAVLIDVICARHPEADAAFDAWAGELETTGTAVEAITVAALAAEAGAR